MRERDYNKFHSEIVLAGRELEVFLKAFDDAKPDLKWIRTVTGHESDYLTNLGYRNKRSSNGLEDLLASFNVVNYYGQADLPEISNEIGSGDAWYSSFRSKECKDGNCGHKTLKFIKHDKKKKKQSKLKTKKFTKPYDESDSDKNNEQDEDYENRFEKKKYKADKTDPEYDDYDSTKGSSRKLVHSKKYKQNDDTSDQSRDDQDNGKDTSDLDYRKYRGQTNEQAQEVNYDSPLFDPLQSKSTQNKGSEKIELKDQLEKTQNDLSHEANYKLSKIEQEAMAKKVRANPSWPLKHPDFQIPLLMQRKAAYDISFDNSKSRVFRQTSKRSLDPLGEVKLKVSERMMAKGLGASLPSDAFNDNRIIQHPSILNDLEDKKRNSIEKFEKELWSSNSDIQKEDVKDDREAHDLNRRDNSGAENKISTGRKLMFIDYELSDDFDQRDGDLNKMKIHKTDAETSDQENYPYFNEKYNDNKKIKTDLEEPFEKIKQKRSNGDDGLTLDFSDSFLKGKDAASCNDKSLLVKPGSKVNSTTMAGASGSSTVIEKSNKTHSQSTPMTFKMNIEFNATVVNSTQEKSLRNTPKKSTFNDRKTATKKSSEYPTDDSADEILVEKRGIIFPPLPFEVSKRTSNAASRNNVRTNEDSPLDCLMSGKLSVQLVNAIFRLVESKEKFRTNILPGLRSRKIKVCSGCHNLASMKNEKNCDQISRSEQMLREVMDTISAIIEQQVRSRTCIPLCSNLRDFYDLIIRTRSENEKKVREIRRRRARDRLNRSHIVYKRDASTKPVVRRKYSVVKKLLNQYGYLPVEDQERNKDLKDMLQMHLVYLKELEEQEKKKRKRELISKTFGNPTTAIKSREAEGDELSPKFTKLVRIAELIRKNSLFSEDIDYSMLQDDDIL